MARLHPCTACGRHFRRHELSCPFCGHRDATLAVAAPIAGMVLGLVLAGCAAPAEKAEAPAPTPTEPATPTPATPSVPAPPDPSVIVGAADSGAAADPSGPPMRPAEKYGAPPLPDDEVTPVADDGPRPAKKYGAPPRPDEVTPVADDGPRPAKKYGAPPRPRE